MKITKRNVVPYALTLTEREQAAVEHEEKDQDRRGLIETIDYATSAFDIFRDGRVYMFSLDPKNDTPQELALIEEVVREFTRGESER